MKHPTQVHKLQTELGNWLTDLYEMAEHSGLFPTTTIHELTTVLHTLTSSPFHIYLYTDFWGCDGVAYLNHKLRPYVSTTNTYRTLFMNAHDNINSTKLSAPILDQLVAAYVASLDVLFSSIDDDFQAYTEWIQEEWTDENETEEDEDEDEDDDDPEDIEWDEKTGGFLTRVQPLLNFVKEKSVEGKPGWRSVPSSSTGSGSSSATSSPNRTTV